MTKAKKKQNLDRPSTSLRLRTFKQGRRAEASARLSLRKAYRLPARKLCYQLDEVELVLRCGRLMVFVEVKFRADRDERASGFASCYPNYAGPVCRFDLFAVGGKGFSLQ